MMTRCFPRGALAIALLLSPTLASAAIERVYGYGYHAALLATDGDEFTNAMVNYAARKGTILSNGRIDKLRAAAGNATLARFEYTWEVPDGAPQRVVIHARSGKPLETIVESQTSSSGSEFEWTDDQIAREASERAYYPSVQGHIRATTVHLRDSVLKATDRGPGSGSAAADAELKALQTLEAEFRSGAIPAGGTLTGTVSQTTCPSCSTNLDWFSTAYRVDGRVYQLIEPRALPGAKAVATEAEMEVLDASASANTAVRSLRKAHIESVMPRGQKAVWQEQAGRRWLELPLLNRLAEAEAGSLAATGCD
jgi:hypothetical protein